MRVHHRYVRGRRVIYVGLPPILFCPLLSFLLFFFFHFPDVQESNPSKPPLRASLDAVVCLFPPLLFLPFFSFFSFWLSMARQRDQTLIPINLSESAYVLMLLPLFLFFPLQTWKQTTGGIVALRDALGLFLAMYPFFFPPFSPFFFFFFSRS